MAPRRREGSGIGDQQASRALADRDRDIRRNLVDFEEMFHAKRSERVKEILTNVFLALRTPIRIVLISMTQNWPNAISMFYEIVDQRLKPPTQSDERLERIELTIRDVEELVLSSRTSIVPDLLGLSEEEAKESLKKARLFPHRVRKVTRLSSAQSFLSGVAPLLYRPRDPYLVIAQSVNAGTEVATRTVIGYVLGRGKGLQP